MDKKELQKGFEDIGMLTDGEVIRVFFKQINKDCKYIEIPIKSIRVLLSKALLEIKDYEKMWNRLKSAMECNGPAGQDSCTMAWLKIMNGIENSEK